MVRKLKFIHEPAFINRMKVRGLSRSELGIVVDFSVWITTRRHLEKRVRRIIYE